MARSLRPGTGAPARSMIGWSRVLAGIGLAVALTAVSTADGNLTRYRDHVLGSTIEDVLRVSGARASDVAMVHEGPTPIQILEWRTPYTRPDAADADPTRALRFAFVDGRLYEIVVDYDRSRISGLTTADLVAGVAAVYGAPATTQVRDADMLTPGSAVLAHWENATAAVILVRGRFGDLQLVVRSIELEADARRAITAAGVRHAAEAPARLQAAQAAADAAASDERTRNKAGFRP